MVELNHDELRGFVVVCRAVGTGRHSLRRTKGLVSKVGVHVENLTSYFSMSIIAAIEWGLLYLRKG